MGPIGESALIILYYLPKESSLEPLRGVPLCEDAFSYFIRKKTPPPLRSIPKRPTYWMVGWVGGCIYLSKKCLEKMWVFFFAFFSNIFSGGTIIIFFHDQQVKNRARRSKMEPKIDTFCHVDTRVLGIFGIKKDVFWTFSKLFWSCLRSVWALFLTIKGPLLVLFSTPKVDKWPRKLYFTVKYLLILTLWGVIFDQFRFK